MHHSKKIFPFLLLIFLSLTSRAQLVFCQSFDDSIVSSQSDILHTFYYHQNTWLNEWSVTDGTPSVFNNSSLPGVTAYQGIQYAGIGICGGTDGCDGLQLLYNFQTLQTYEITLVARNWNSYQAVMTYYLLPVPYTHVYDSTRGCSNEWCGIIPPGAVQVFISSPPNQWNTQSFSFTPTSNFQSLWFSISSSVPIPNGSAAIYCIDSICLKIACIADTLDIGNDTSYCGNFSRILSTGNANTLWNNGLIASQITVDTGGVYWAELPNGCGVPRDSIAIFQNNLPYIDIGDSAFICSEDSILLQPSMNAAYFVWSTGAHADSIYALQGGVYWIEVWDTATCRNRDSVFITIANPPSFTLGNDTSVCASDSAQICAPPAFADYHWNNGATTNCISANLAGNYYVTITDNNGCTAESNHLTLSVYPAPPVSISVNADTLSVFNAVTQQWYLNGNPITNATSNVFIANQGGIYTVAVTDSHGCVATSSAIIISGIEQLWQEDLIIVYPNPATDQLNIKFSGLLSEQINIYNVDGKLVSQTNEPANNQIDVRSLPMGVYVAQVKVREAIQKVRWVKM